MKSKTRHQRSEAQGLSRQQFLLKNIVSVRSEDTERVVSKCRSDTSNVSSAFDKSVADTKPEQAILKL